MEGIEHELLEPLFNELRAEGFDYTYTPDSIIDDLQMIETELVNSELAKEGLEDEERNTAVSNAAPTEETFLEMLAEIRKFERYNTPVTRLADEMTVYDYALSLKRYNEEVNRLQRQNLKEHGNR